MPKVSPSKLIIDNFATTVAWVARSMTGDRVLPYAQMSERSAALKEAAMLLRRAKLDVRDRRTACRCVESAERRLIPAYQAYRAAGGDYPFTLGRQWFGYLRKRVGEPY